MLVELVMEELMEWVLDFRTGGVAMLLVVNWNTTTQREDARMDG